LVYLVCINLGSIGSPQDEPFWLNHIFQPIYAANIRNYFYTSIKNDEKSRMKREFCEKSVNFAVET
jgi:hypothetical protein